MGIGVIPDNVKTKAYTWNTDDLEWEAMQQPVVEYGGNLVVEMGDVQKLLAEGFWVNIKYDYDPVTGDCIYKGMNTSLNASDDDVTWFILRFDYTSGDCTQKRVKTTSWTERTIGW